MNSLVDLIEKHFGIGVPPREHELVKFDGFDELDKKDALSVFFGKTTEEISKALSERGTLENIYVLGTISDVEDLVVMEPTGYQYYLAPYLIRIIQNANEELEDLELAGLVMSAVCEIFRMRGVDAFSEGQRVAFRNLGNYLAKQCRKNSEDTWAEPLIKSLELLETKLVLA